jgi:hypothetical protein
MSLDALKQSNSGGRSLQRTALCDYFPITGINKGIFLIWARYFGGNRFYRFAFRTFTALKLSIPSPREQGTKNTYQGIAFPDRYLKLG